QVRARALQAADPALASPYLTVEFTQAVASVRDDVRVAILGGDGGARAYYPYQRAGADAVPIGGTLNDFQAVVAPAHMAWAPRDLLRATGAARLCFDHWIAAQEAALRPHVAAWSESPF